MRKILIFLVFLLLIFTCGCINNNKNLEEHVKVKDLLGRDVEVPKDVNRIVCIGPGCLRLIVYLNATDKVVGVEDAEKLWTPYGRPYRLAHPELAKLPTIGQGGPNPKPNLEEILKVEPDVIFACYITKEQADKIQERTGIPVVVLSYGKLATFNEEELYTSLELAGKILNKEDRAKEVIKFIDNCLNDLNSRTKDIPEDKKLTVYVGGIGYKGQRGIESTMCKYPPFEAVHARNVVDQLNKTGHVFISKEQLLKWNPDIIFIDEGGLKLVINDYKRNKEFYNSLKAFKNGDVYGLLPYNFYTTNIGTALADAYYIGKILYPERFKDINPEEKADEIYVFLVGKPVYKEMAQFWGGFKRLNLSESND
ncbi:periplasmic binding protein [Methanocaldococcus infernus ME]|uniref:Periplasmic binding protein n=1 Tax=Methanocaldococcus infernus (strain DSM 11812 / JCM 15783 / ME) TaxID=573063 RepID=D5VU23_METIM|nr:iron ABC transporter substrate-binding protein [Methanocaldococcus infernus]ADG14076.1 periplasmic binding protein [Methanocaldococcus infernus ME]